MEENRNKIKRKVYVYTAWLVCGLVLVALAVSGVVEGEFFAPFGIAWSALSLARIIRYTRLLKDQNSLNEYLMFENDERNLMIKHRAISYASYVFIFISLGVIIASEFLGYYTIAATIASMICIYVIIYTIAVIILRRTY